MSYAHVLHLTSRPAPLTLATMGKAAREASQSWTMREWAGTLAAGAGHRDFVGQLRRLYDGILERWRYVQEPDEWTHGTGRSLLAHVLGVKYQPGATDPERFRVAGTTWGQRGWGDCDDVSALVAAGALSLGMKPTWRVIAWPGGAHVSTVVRTPDGQLVHLDPVGHPHKPFGWAYSHPDGVVSLYTLDGRPLGPPSEGATNMLGQTALAGYDECPQCSMGAVRTHLALVQPGDELGPRVLGIPQNYYRLFRRGLVVDGCPGVDQFGEQYEYDASSDTWQPGHAVPMGAFGGRRSRRERRRRRRARRRRVLRRVVRRVAKAVRRVAKPLRRIASRILGSKIVQGILSKFLAIYGVPPVLTRKILAREAKMIRKGGRVRLLKLIVKRKWKSAAKEMLKSLKGPGFGEVQYETPMMGALGEAFERGARDAEAGAEYVMEQDGGAYPVAYVGAFVPLGEVDPAQMVVSDVPEPGKWYRVKRGDSLLRVAGTAYGLRAGRERLDRARWINRAAANAPYIDAGLADRMFPGGRISFRPRYAADPAEAITGAKGRAYALVYIPLTEGDEPPEKVEAEPEPEPAPPPEPEPAPEPEPELPAPPEEPPTPLPDVTPPPPPEPEPAPPPAKPAPPVEPTPAPEEPAPEEVPEPPAEPEEAPPVVLKPTKPPRCPEGMVWVEQAQACAYPTPTVPPPGFPRRDEVPAPPPVVAVPAPPPPVVVPTAPAPRPAPPAFPTPTAPPPTFPPRGPAPPGDLQDLGLFITFVMLAS